MNALQKQLEEAFKFAKKNLSGLCFELNSLNEDGVLPKDANLLDQLAALCPADSRSLGQQAQAKSIVYHAAVEKIANGG